MPKEASHYWSTPSKVVECRNCNLLHCGMSELCCVVCVCVLTRVQYMVVTVQTLELKVDECLKKPPTKK